jgi:hypothetical protein
LGTDQAAAPGDASERTTGCPIYSDVMQAEVAFVLTLALVLREPDAADQAIADAIDAATQV